MQKVSAIARHTDPGLGGRCNERSAGPGAGCRQGSGGARLSTLPPPLTPPPIPGRLPRAGQAPRAPSPAPSGGVRGEHLTRRRRRGRRRGAAGRRPGGQAPGRWRAGPGLPAAPGWGSPARILSQPLRKPNSCVCVRIAPRWPPMWDRCFNIDLISDLRRLQVSGAAPAARPWGALGRPGRTGRSREGGRGALGRPGGGCWSSQGSTCPLPIDRPSRN